MKVLVLYDDSIRAWLISEPLESVPLHIQNGYPELQADYMAETINAEVIDVPDADAFSSHLYEVRDGSPRLKEQQD